MEKKNQLPKEFGEKWIAALRSGGYKQGKQQLSKYGCYCCLGVACAIEGVTDFGEYQWMGDDKEYNYMNDYPKTIPKQIVGGPMKNELVGILARKNDDGVTFNEISDWITENIELI